MCRRSLLQPLPPNCRFSTRFEKQGSRYLIAVREARLPAEFMILCPWITLLLKQCSMSKAFFFVYLAFGKKAF